MIKLEHVSKSYTAGIPALNDVSLDIEEGEFVFIVGDSGSGKSTLIKLLLKELEPTEGTITINNKKLNKIKRRQIPKFRRNIGVVFQDFRLLKDRNIYDNVAFGPRTHGVHRKKELDEIVEKSLKQAALWDEVSDKLKKSALALSGGQQQRLCIARALAVNPEVILMDEPTSALDPISTSKIEDLVLELKKEYTIIIVTHSMQQAARISDKTAFFLLGEVIEFGDTEKIFTSPSDKRTEDYITGRFG